MGHYTVNHQIYNIAISYIPCNIPPTLLNNEMAISINCPISNITQSVGLGPQVVLFIGPAFLQFAKAFYAIKC